jgi:hypothetical protein
MRYKCKYIAPIFDILPLSQLHFDKSNQNLVIFNDFKNPDSIAITFQKRISKGKEVLLTSTEVIPIDSYFSFTGKVNRKIDDFVEIYVEMEKKDFNYELFNLCRHWGCKNIDLKANFEKRNLIGIPFYLLKDEIDVEVLQMLKLKYMKDQPKNIKNNYQHIKYTNYENEIRADLMYLKLIVEPEGLNKVKFINVLKDYLKLKGIYKSINSFNILSNSIKISQLENKINIIEIACIKAETRNNQEDLILDRMISDVRIDLERLKNNYIH